MAVHFLNFAPQLGVACKYLTEPGEDPDGVGEAEFMVIDFTGVVFWYKDKDGLTIKTPFVLHGGKLKHLDGPISYSPTEEEVGKQE